MSTPYLPSRHVACDYKYTGSELLSLLRGEYDLPCLDSVELDELLADPACDLAGESLATLAGGLAPAGVQLWQIDFYEDTVYVALLLEDEVAAFEQYWQVDYLNEPDAVHFAPRLRRIKPARVRANKTAARQAVQRGMQADRKPNPKLRKRPQVDLIVETYSLPAAPDLNIDRSINFFYSKERAYFPDNGKFIDFSTWPPRALPLPDHRTDKRFVRSWQPVIQSGSRNVWLCRDQPNGDFQLAQIDDMDHWTPQWLGSGARLRGTLPQRMRGGLLHITTGVDEQGEPVYEVANITQGACEVWYRSQRPLQAFAFAGAARCVIVEDHAALAVADGPVTNADFVRLPAASPMVPGSVIPLEGSMVVYFSSTGTGLRMHKLDLSSGKESLANLPGFGYRSLQDGQPGFDKLVVHQGHDDWWIVNHECRKLGDADVALLWNARTDETIKIHRDDFALHPFTLLYLGSLDRYLGILNNIVMLLWEFDALYGSMQRETLTWEPNT